MINRREAILGTLLAASGISALAIRPSLSAPAKPPGDIDEVLARSIGGWGSKEPVAVITGTADELGSANYGELGVRMFQPAMGRAVTVLLARGLAQGYATQLHRPEFCYPASGFKIDDYRALQLTVAGRTIPASVMVAHRGDRVDTVLYWTRIGNRFPKGLWEQRLEIARAAFAGGKVDEVLVRLSVTDPSTAASEAVLKNFADQFVLAQSPLGKNILIGNR